jgi:phosphoribosyl 1,2-cyclic phosphate phosphodiesterase
VCVALISRAIVTTHTYFTHIEATENLNETHIEQLEQQLKEEGLLTTIAIVTLS